VSSVAAIVVVVVAIVVVVVVVRKMVCVFCFWGDRPPFFVPFLPPSLFKQRGNGIQRCHHPSYQHHHQHHPSSSHLAIHQGIATHQPHTLSLFTAVSHPRLSFKTLDRHQLRRVFVTKTTINKRDISSHRHTSTSTEPTMFNRNIVLVAAAVAALGVVRAQDASSTDASYSEVGVCSSSWLNFGKRSSDQT
jgi:hypothetical protein